MEVTRVGGPQGFYTQGHGGPKSSTRFQEGSPLVHALLESTLEPSCGIFQPLLSHSVSGRVGPS